MADGRQRGFQRHLGSAQVALRCKQIRFKGTVQVTTLALLSLFLLALDPVALLVGGLLRGEEQEALATGPYLCLHTARLIGQRKRLVAARPAEDVAAEAAVVAAHKESKVQPAHLAVVHQVVLHPQVGSHTYTVRSPRHRAGRPYTRRHSLHAL